MKTLLPKLAIPDTERLYNEICSTAEVFRDLSIINQTRLSVHHRLTQYYGAEKILVKYESEQPVGAYKNRGGANNIRHFSEDERQRGAILASAGNHASGTALACAYYGVDADIYMPEGTSPVKIENTTRMGKGRVSIQIIGDTFDASHNEALCAAQRNGKKFVHPFDSEHTVVGQGTIADEICAEIPRNLDFVFGALGGGGMSSAVSTYLQTRTPNTQYIGVEPEGAAAMQSSLREGSLVTLKDIDTFVDGAAVRTPGKLPYDLLRDNTNATVTTVTNRETCSALIDLLDIDGIQSELAGALPFAALQKYADEIRDKTVVVILSGKNISTAKLKTVRSLV